MVPSVVEEVWVLVKKLFLVSFFCVILFIVGDCLMIKMIFSDFDETMLNYHSKKNYFDDYQVSILKRLSEKGIMFSIVTGRNVFFFQKFPEILPYISYILASNGSCIYDVYNKKFIYQKLIGEQEVVFLLDYARNNHFDLYYNCDGMQYFNEDDVDLKGCEQVILSFNERYLESILEDIKNIPFVNYNNICRHGVRYTIDVNNSSVSKGNAVTFLCEYLGISLDDTIGFGDSDNDISMFHVVGKGVSVSNATSKMKMLANEITLSSEEDGIFKYIEKNILN